MKANAKAAPLKAYSIQPKPKKLMKRWRNAQDLQPLLEVVVNHLFKGQKGHFCANRFLVSGIYFEGPHAFR